MNRKIIHASLAAILLAGWMTRAAWADPTVTDIALVSEKRISRTVFEYTYKATITNDGTARKNVQATLSGAGTGTTITEGAINVGDLAVNQVITPTDTFTIRQDRTYAFNRAALVWSFSGETEIIPDAPGNLGELVIFPQVIPTGRDTKVTVMVKIDNPIVFSGNPKLDRLDNSGNVQSSLGNLLDDGTAGDTVAGDRWYTLQGIVNEATPGTILIRAAAMSKATGEEIVSPIGIVEVEAGADASGPFATQQTDKLVFRNADGSIASEVNLAPAPEPYSDDTGNYFIVNNLFAIPTKNQKRVGIVTITSLVPDQSPQETETDTPHGSSFVFRDADAVLWSKSLPADSDTQFYVPDSDDGPNAMFSADGNRILLIVVNDQNGSPKTQIYDASGSLIQEFTSKLQALITSRISANGRYVLLEGTFPLSDFGSYGFEAFNIDTGESITQLLDLEAIDSYDVVEDGDGKFKIWADGATLYQLP